MGLNTAPGERANDGKTGGDADKQQVAALTLLLSLQK